MTCLPYFDVNYTTWALPSGTILATFLHHVVIWTFLKSPHNCIWQVNKLFEDVLAIVKS